MLHVTSHVPYLVPVDPSGSVPTIYPSRLSHSIRGYLSVCSRVLRDSQLTLSVDPDTANDRKKTDLHNRQSHTRLVRLCIIVAQLMSQDEAACLVLHNPPVNTSMATVATDMGNPEKSDSCQVPVFIKV